MLYGTAGYVVVASYIILSSPGPFLFSVDNFIFNKTFRFLVQTFQNSSFGFITMECLFLVQAILLLISMKALGIIIKRQSILYVLGSPTGAQGEAMSVCLQITPSWEVCLQITPSSIFCDIMLKGKWCLMGVPDRRQSVVNWELIR